MCQYEARKAEFLAINHLSAGHNVSFASNTGCVYVRIQIDGA